MTEQLEARLRAIRAYNGGRIADVEEAADTLKRYREALEYMRDNSLIDDDYRDIARQALANRP